MRLFGVTDQLGFKYQLAKPLTVGSKINTGYEVVNQNMLFRSC